MPEMTQAELAQIVTAFVKEIEDRIADPTGQYELAWWNMATTGSEQAISDWERLAVKLRQALNDPTEFQTVRSWYDQRQTLTDPLLRRQLEVLYAKYLGAQEDPQLTQEIVRLEGQVESAYNNYRGSYQGQRLSDNELKKILSDSHETAEVREAYLAGKGVGAEVAVTVLKLAELRNVSARAVGYRDYYQQALLAQELEESQLFDLMDQLERVTDEPYRAAKAIIDARLIERFGLTSASELRPWHYADPFFQQAPAPANDPLEGLFRDGHEIEELTVKTYDGLGLEVRDVLARSDLYERDGKSQHAFCQHIDRRTDDVRVLCNLQPTVRWMETNLHEFGHAVYDKYINADLPYFLRTDAHLSTTEAIAMLMGRQATNGRWLSQIKGLDESQLAERVAALSETQRFQMLVFMRWGLVMVHFEQAMYADPTRPDLNKLWWDYVERFQLLTRPDDRDMPDWAAKIHLATAPAYYQNYVIGELTASQLQAYIETHVPGNSLIQNQAAGQFLLELFRLGARFDWSDTVEQVTGEPLNPAYFVQQTAA